MGQPVVCGDVRILYSPTISSYLMIAIKLLFAFLRTSLGINALGYWVREILGN